MSTASALGLGAGDGVVVHNSNRIAVRLTPCDVLARVAPLAHQAGAALEVAVGRRLAEAGCPVAEPDPRVEPRVYVRDGFAITLWTYYAAVSPQDIAPAAYAQTLARYHAGLRPIDLTVPHFTDRVAEAQGLVDDRAQTPELDDTGRTLLGTTLRGLRRAIVERGAPEQLLHGEPHPGNVLHTTKGLLLIDLETCCRGPVEFDLAHAPEDVSAHYPAVDQGLLRACRVLTLAMVTAWRWDRDDQLPDRPYWRIEGLNQVRIALDRYGMDVAD
jgi:aminoglycoside phosphotransferase (APT) family kinase protein